MQNQRGLAWTHATRMQGVQPISPQHIQFLTDNYPHPVPFSNVIDGCEMPDTNPDLPWLIMRHRADHVKFWETHQEYGPHRLEDAEEALIASGRRDVLLIGGGWSAGENMALVRRWIGIKKPIVIAVNRAAVCWPDADVFFITERQANEYWWRHANPKSVCVTAPSCNPKVLDHFEPQQFAYFGTPWCWHDKWEDAPEWAYKPPLVCLPACETTMSMALAWTIRLKPLRVIFLGVDHCWPAYTENYDNVWLPGPYYCDGYPWNGPETVNRYVRRGINGRMVVCNQFNERQATVFKRACEQIQVNNGLSEPPVLINGSAHGILDFNEDNRIFMRECDESMAEDTKRDSERLHEARVNPQGILEPPNRAVLVSMPPNDFNVTVADGAAATGHISPRTSESHPPLDWSRQSTITVHGGKRVMPDPSVSGYVEPMVHGNAGGRVETDASIAALGYEPSADDPGVP